MKANLPRSVTGKGPFHGHDIRLTIGLIVKNEEKTLEKCLDSIQPLLNAVPSELIITDTGSTDRTVEIARRYTDHIIHFEWCGDFAAARNTGLKEARGEWFMFLDGDEWFEDTTEIIDFFNSGECDKYGSASYLQRNYLEYGNSEKYEDFHALRIYRFYAGMVFKNMVHETIDRMDPVKFFDAYVHHYGYAYRSEEEKLKKHRRNVGLLQQELAVHPDNLKMYDQLANQYYIGDEYEKGLECCRKGLEMEKQYPNPVWKIVFYHTILFGYVFMISDEKVLETLEEIEQADMKEELQSLDFYRLGQLACLRQKKYDEGIRFGERYLNLYKKYKEGQLDPSMFLYGSVKYYKEQTRQFVILDLCQCYAASQRAEEAETYLSMLDLSSEDFPKEKAFSCCFQIAQICSHWNLVYKFYERVLQMNDAQWKKDFIAYAESFMQTFPEAKSWMPQAFYESELEDDYVMLNRLRFMEEMSDREGFQTVMDWFARKDSGWEETYSDVLYFAIKEKMNIMPYLMHLDTDELPYFSANIFKQHPDFAQIIPEYFHTFSFENPKGLFWSNCLKEKAVLAEKEPEDEEAYLSVFEDYARQTAAYVRKLYRPEMFSSANLAALPRAYRFGFYMGEAFSAKKRGDDAAYLANLRTALENYPIMEKPIGLLLERFEKKQKEQQRKSEEFQALAKKVKKQIESLIAGGRLEEAGKITAQLSALLPGDEDIVRYRVLTHTEPSMREIAAKLPQ